MERVPTLYEEVRSGKIGAAGAAGGRGLAVIVDDQAQSSLKKKSSFQQPSLFDSAKKTTETVLARRE